jgi:hypothetical protein
LLCLSVFQTCFGQPEVDSISEENLQSEANVIAETQKNYNNHHNNDNDFAYFETEVGNDAGWRYYDVYKDIPKERCRKVQKHEV